MKDITNLTDKRHKVILVGDSDGKKGDILKNLDPERDAFLNGTLGIDFVTKNFLLANQTYILQIWNCDGQERPRSMSDDYFRGASAAVIVVDLDKSNSNQRVRYWTEEVKRSVDDKIKIFLVGVSLSNDDSVHDVPKNISKEFIISYFAMEGIKEKTVDDLFTNITKTICFL